MSNILIITDNLHLSYAVKTRFVAAHWRANDVDLMNFISHDNRAETTQYQCAVLFVGKGFADKYSHLIDDVSESIKSYAANMPIYLAFEDNYDNRFYWWRLRSKRIFESVDDDAVIEALVHGITNLENSMQGRAYVSPMG